MSLFYVAVSTMATGTVASPALKMKMAPVRHGGSHKMFRNPQMRQMEEAAISLA